MAPDQMSYDRLLASHCVVCTTEFSRMHLAKGSLPWPISRQRRKRAAKSLSVCFFHMQQGRLAVGSRQLHSMSATLELWWPSRNPTVVVG